MDTAVNEIAPGIFQLSTYVAPADLRFNQYLVLAEQPLLAALEPAVMGLMHGPAFHGDGALALRNLAAGYAARLQAAATRGEGAGA